MMTALMFAALLFPQEDEGIPRQVDARSLEKKIAALEASLQVIARRRSEALERGDLEAARGFDREDVATREQIDALRARLDRLQEGRPARDWYESINIEFSVLLTHWDDDLDLEDGPGWAVAAHFNEFLFLEARRWEADDREGSGDATVTSYEIGFMYEFGLQEEKSSALVIQAGMGLAKFSGDANDDSGPIFSFTPHCKFHLSSRIRLNVGADLDVARTRFNQDHTHTVHTFSLFASLEYAY